MLLVLRKLFEAYNVYFLEKMDKRSDGYFIVDSFPLLLTILSGYLLMIKYGPKVMESRKPFELKNVLIVYNFLQVILNTMLGVYGTYYVFFVHGFDFRCQGVNYSNTEIGIRELRLSYSYFLLKILDLLDTLFIILRKKDTHLSFLHCYHHFFMALGIYIGVRFVPGGSGIVLGIINLFVHSFMYFYYFMTAFKPELKKSIWWKKHITQFQLIQFALLIVHFLRSALASNCSFPKFWLWTLVIQNTFMFSMFSDFYYKTYLKKKKSMD